jgi:hypothetical protein
MKSMFYYAVAFDNGRVVQDLPMKPTLKTPGTKLLKLKHDVPLRFQTLLSISTCAATQ